MKATIEQVKKAVESKLDGEVYVEPIRADRFGRKCFEAIIHAPNGVIYSQIVTAHNTKSGITLTF